MTKDAKLTTGDQEVSLPVVEATEGNRGFDVSTLLRDTGATTFDVGFANTAACRSAITYIDGDAGILRYRGYPIEQLAEHSTFLETAYLVLYGQLPTQHQLETFERRIKESSLLDERMRDLFRCFPRRSHPMPVLSAGIMALSTFNFDSTSVDDPEQIETATINLLGKCPTFAAYGFKNSHGEPMLYPKLRLGYVHNFLRLSFALPTAEYVPDPKVLRALETLLILHADHEQNCSTSTVRLVGSSRADIYTCVASGVNALSGPLHGGANQQVVEMLERIQADGGDADRFVAQVKDRGAGARLMGFGHRVYKNYDPRAAIVKKHADHILSDGPADELLDIALRLEEIALSDDYFIERRLYPNVDFYTGLIYQALGFPTNMFTVLFALGRLPGWIAHWREMNADPATKIGRPRQIYTGETEREYVPIDERAWS